MSILHVNADADAQPAITRCLRQAGFAVREAATGVEALRLAAGKPDLVLLARHLPDQDGLEVCRRLKADPDTALIPVLLLLSAPDGASNGLEEWVDGCLTTPVRP